MSEKFKTGRFILFGNVPKKGWVKVFYQSIGALNEYKLIRKKVFPVVMICGNCAYFESGACLHENSRDNCADSDSDRKCYHDGFTSIPYNWDSYKAYEKEKFRLNTKTVKIGLSISDDSNSCLCELIKRSGKTKSRVFEEAIKYFKSREDIIYQRMLDIELIGDYALLSEDELQKIIDERIANE